MTRSTTAAARQPQTPPATMSALVASARGGPEQLHLAAVATPSPGEFEVLVAVDAASITFAELSWDETWARTPVVPSHEMSGVVAAVGARAGEWAVGDEVLAQIRFDRQGAAAPYVTVPAADLSRRPPGISPATAAALPLAGLTAWQALVEHGHVHAGDEVLVHGGAGGVGTFAVQLAARLGARVTATGRGADAALLRALGAAATVDFERELFDAVPRRFDVVIDTVSGDTLHRSFPVLRPGGRLVTLSGPPDANRAAEYSVEARFFIVTPDRAALDTLARLVAAGELTVPISATFQLADGAAAFASAATPGRAPGKTVLVVPADSEADAVA
jgi:NADPH:quinone reductase-like Zn-dependent oxidoreductase